MQHIEKCTPDCYQLLTQIWQRAVKATHSFLSQKDFDDIGSKLSSDYFPNVELFALIDNNIIAGFIGLAQNKIEMLFIDADKQHQGHGSTLLDFAINAEATLVDVNEQNSDALKFYLSKGFNIISRDQTDDAGRPYPILHLSL